MPESIILSLFDYDECLSHRRMMSSNCKDIIYQNKELLKNITRKYKAFSPDAEIKVGCISARQSKGQDISISNKNKTGSCYLAIQEISAHLSVPVEPLLLADVYGDLPKGTSFFRSLNPNNQFNHATHIPDKSKLTIFHAQIHDMAESYPNKRIYIDCYDDRSDILCDLINFYSLYPEMIPSSVTICFNHYAGEAITELKTIEGTGEIDFHYRQTVIDMIEITEKIKGEGRLCIHHVSPEKLMKYREKYLSDMPSDNEFSHLRHHEKHHFLHTYKTNSLKEELGRWQRFEHDDVERLFPLEKMRIENKNEACSTILQTLLIGCIKRDFIYGVQLVGYYDSSLLNQITISGLIPLHEAVNRNRVSIVEYLIRMRVSLEISTQHYANISAIGIAVYKSYEEIAVLLFKYGASVLPPVAGENHLMHVLARRCLVDELKQLLELWIDLVNSPDKENNTILHYLLKSSDKFITEWFIQRGALANVWETIDKDCDYDLCSNEAQSICDEVVKSPPIWTPTLFQSGAEKSNDILNQSSSANSYG